MPKVNIENAKAEIKKMVSLITEIPEKDLIDEARFTEDLGIDSMMALEIVASLEKKYKITIPEDLIPTVRSMKNVYELVDKLLK